MNLPSGRVEEVFLLAIDRDPAEWKAILDRECAGDGDLRREVAELLKCHADTDDFMDSKVAPGKGLLTRIGADAAAGEEVALPPDRMVGRFKVLERIGAGGMGIVYIAEQDRPKRTVALKVLRLAHASPRMLRRFEYEADVLGRLHHPGIAQVFEAGAWSHDNITRPFIAMELVRGLPIGRHCEHHKLSAIARLELVAKVCDAVHHAHQAGVIHRDLKPGNILVSETGQPKLLDFGVARPLHNDLQLTTSMTGLGALIGTLPYMSPEQVLGDPNAIDTRSDVYAIGVILYELLAGKLPYDIRSRSLPEAARIIRDEEPRKLSGYDREFRGEIETIVSQALEKNRDRRYQSAAELGDDIRRHLAGQPILARNASRWYIVQKQLHRHRAWVAAGTATFLGLVAFAAFAAIQAQKERTARIDATSALGEANRQRSLAREANDKLTAELRVSTIENGRLRSRTGDLASAEAALWPEHFASPGSTHTYWALWEMYFRNSMVSATVAHDKALNCSALSPDGKTYATGGEDGQIRFWRAADLSPVAEILAHEPNARIVGLHYSPDGAMLVSASRDRNIVVHSADAKRMIARALNRSPVRKFAVDRDFTHLAACGEDGLLTIYTLPDLKPVSDIRFPRAPYLVAFAPDGQSVAVGVEGGAIRCATLDGRDIFSERAGLVHTGGGPQALLADPVTGDLLSGGRDRLIRRSDAKTGQILSTYTSTAGTVSSLDISHDGSRIAAGGWWRMEVLDGPSLKRLHSFPTPDGIMTVHLAGDNRYVIAGLTGGEARIWELQPGGRIDLPGHAGRVTAAFSPDNKYLLTGDSAGTARLFALPSLRPLASWKAHTGRLRSAVFCHEGDRAYAITCGENDAMRVWDYKTAALVREIPDTLEESGGYASVSPDGRYLAYAMKLADGRMAITDTKTWKIVATFPREGYGYINSTFSPDGAYIATTNRGRSVALWSTKDWSLVTRISPGGAQPWAVSFAPDSSKLLVSAWNRISEIRSVPSLNHLGTLTGHTALVGAVDWCPTDQRLAVSVSTDGTLRMWDTTELRNLVLISLSEAGVEGIHGEWSPDGRGLVVTGSEGTCFLVDCAYYERAMVNHFRMMRKRKDLVTTPENLAALDAWADRIARDQWPRLGPTVALTPAQAAESDAVAAAWKNPPSFPPPASAPPDSTPSP